MSSPHPRTPDPEERRKLFRRMEWVFVYAPPLLILFLGGSSAALLAWLAPLPGMGFWAKWLIFVILIIGLPGIAYAIRQWLRR